MKKKLKAVDVKPLLKLDLGCGLRPKEGFLGVDSKDFGQKVTHDLRKPWPWEDGSVEEVYSSHFLEHLTSPERVHFFNELYRVLIKGGKATIIVPHWSSERAYGDPTHQWPPVVFFSFQYINKVWREANAPHTGYTCDFDTTGGNAVASPWNSKNQETQLFAQMHYINVCQDLFCTVVKR